MPPTGALAPRDIETLTRWIDEGAVWPDALANEAPPVPPSQHVLDLSDAIRARNWKRAQSIVATNAQAVNGRGHRGTTPLMYASLYGDAAHLKRMLVAGADPNVRSDAGTTALMWALDDIEKVRVLLEHGAEVNARSNRGRTPLSLAARQLESAGVVRLLLDRGAAASQADLAAAAGRGNLEVIRMLLAAGARDGGEAATVALRADCLPCVDALMAAPPSPSLRRSLAIPPVRSATAIRFAVERGADVNARDAQGHTVLMRVALTDILPADVAKLLIERGADATVKTAEGHTALDFARKVGDRAVIDALVSARATAIDAPAPPVTFVRGNTAAAAIRRSLPLLQRTAEQFYRKSGCVSCHHNALTGTVSAARARKIPVDERLARKEIETAVTDATNGHDLLVQGEVMFGGGPPTIGYVLLGLAAERHPRDLATDAMVRLLRLSQRPDGRWTGTYRPPHESSEFTFTAVNMRGIQQYGNDASCAGCQEAVRRAAAWLSRSTPQNTEDRVFRLFGLTWARAAAGVRESAIADHIGAQRQDGGWAQLSTLGSDAYATGSALVALHQAGVSVKNPAYRRGVEFLLSTQLTDGSWLVRKRALPTQPYFESGFPHGVDQFISAAATNWATLALIAAE